MEQAVSRSIWLEMESGPVATFGLIVTKHLKTSMLEQSTEDSKGTLGGGSGKGAARSTAFGRKTDAKCWFKSSALPAASQASVEPRCITAGTRDMVEEIEWYKPQKDFGFT